MSPAFNILFKRIIILGKISFFFAPVLVSAQTQKESVQNKLGAYFIKDAAVKNFVALTKDSLFIYPNALAKAAKKKAEFALSWKQVKTLSPYISKLSTKELENILTKGKDSIALYANTYKKVPQLTFLKGLKVAIDPGHIGGTYAMAETESRCMTLQVDSSGQPDSIRLVEGNLTFFTAQILKKKLEAQGAEVMLTRMDTGLSALDMTFKEWKKRIKSRDYVDSLISVNLLREDEVRWLHRRIPDKELFEKVFGFVDMAERAKKINAFHPDLTVVIHYNVNEVNIGWTHPTNRDYVMTFVPGCVTTKDLNTVAGRLNLLRLLISPDIDNSVAFSSDVVQRLSKDLSVPIAHKEDATYLSKHSLTTPKDGVFSRDLALTRLIHGTLVYGEALYQDNSMECCMLSGKGIDFKGCSISQRIGQVAQAYYEGILDYLDSLKRK